MYIVFCFRIIFFCIILFYSSFVFSAINKININGLINYSDISLLKKINNYFYKKEIETSNIIDFFHSLNLFKFVKLSTINDSLCIDVIELPVIHDIKIFGTKDKKHIFSILNKLNIHIGSIYNNYTFVFFRQYLEKYYINKGYYNVSVEINVNLDDNKNKLDVSINLNTLKKQKIKKIKIVGNKIFTSDKLLRLLSHSKSNFLSWFTNDDIYLKGKLVSDLDIIKSYYIDRGYIGFYISSTKILLSKDGKKIYIYIHLNEGNKYYVGDINITNDYFSINDKLKFILYDYFRSGDVFSRKKLLEGQRKIRDYFYNKGYINSSVNFNIINVGSNTINIEFFVEKKQRVIVRKILFVGNNITEDKILRRNIPQQEGDWISMHDINFGKEEIVRLGLASNIDINVKKYDKNGKYIDVFYKIDEQKTTKFIIGCSYNSFEGLMLNAGTELSNFLGIGRDVSFNINRNKNGSEYNFSYYNQQLDGLHFGVGYNLYYRSEKLEKISGNFERFSNTFGGSMHYSYKFKNYIRFNGGFGCDLTRLRMDEETSSDEVTEFLAHEGFDFKEYYFTFLINYNSLEKLIFPSNGMYNNLAFRLSLPFSNLKYYVLNYNLNYYKRLSDNFIFNIFSVIYYGNKYHNTYSFPFFKNFFIRGNTKVRGFKDKSLGPRDSNGHAFGGNMLFNLKMSLYFPVLFLSDYRTIRTGMFIDIGQVFNTNDFENDMCYNNFYDIISDIKLSCGFALTWSTPFGIPFEVSISYPLNMKFGDKRRILLLTFGM